MSKIIIRVLNIIKLRKISILAMLLLGLIFPSFADLEKIPGSMSPPTGVDSSKIPLFVLLTFEDNRYADGVNWVCDSLFGNHVNSSGSGNKATYDGAPIRGNFYVIGNSDIILGKSNFETTKSWKRAFDLGNEVGNHSWTHLSNYSDLNDNDLFNEISNCNRQLNNVGGIPHINIYGHDTPYLAYSADGTSFNKEAELGLLYDCTLDNNLQGLGHQEWVQPYFLGTMENGWIWLTDLKANGLWQIPHAILSTTETGNFTSKNYDSGIHVGWSNADLSDTLFVNSRKWAIDFHYSRNRAPLMLNFHSDYYSEDNNVNAPVNGWAVPLVKRRQALKDVVAYLLSLPDVRIVTGIDVIRWMRNPVELTDLSRNDELTFKTDNSSGTISEGVDTTDANGSSITVNGNVCNVSVKDTLNGITEGYAGLNYSFSKTLDSAHSVQITYNSDIPLNFILNQSDLGNYSYRLGLASTGGRDTTVQVPIVADYFMQPRPIDTTYRLPLDLSKVSSASLIATALDTTMTGIFSGSFEIFGAGALVEVPKYVLTVNNGTGDGSYLEGETISIVGDFPSTGKKFIGWTGDTTYVDSPLVINANVNMPAESVTVTANYADIQYTLNVINGTGDGDYILGTEVPVSADQPPANHIFNGWIGNTENLENIDSASTKITMPASNVSIEATYLDTTTEKYSLTVNSGSGSGLYVEGDSIPILANTPDIGKKFIRWDGDTAHIKNVLLDSTLVYIPADSITVTAIYEDVEYLLTVTNGTGSGNYTYNSKVPVTADNPPANHVFNGWVGTGVDFVDSVNNVSVIVTMPAESISLVAQYRDTTKPTFNLTVNNGTGSGEYNEGESVIVKANDPAVGMQFLKWIGDTASVEDINSDSTTVIIPDSSITLTATYENKKYNLTVTNGSGGGAYISGSPVTVVANTPPANHVFNGWIGETSYLENFTLVSTILTMPTKDVSIEASYRDTTKANFNLTVYSGTGSGSYNEGVSISISANVAEEGKIFSGWVGDTEFIDSVNSPNAKVTMPGKDVTLTATYTDKLFPLIVKNGSGSGSYKKGDIIQIAGATPELGKMFNKWLGDSTAITNVNSISTTVIMPDTNITVTATYVDVPIVMAGDFNGDSTVDALDFSYVSTFWTNSSKGKTDSIQELAPYNGDVPYITVNPDGKFDFEDLSVFTSSCYWFFDNRQNYLNDDAIKHRNINSNCVDLKVIQNSRNVKVVISGVDVKELVTLSVSVDIEKTKYELRDIIEGDLFSNDDSKFLKFSYSEDERCMNSITSRLSDESIGVSGSGKICEFIYIINEYEVLNTNISIQYTLVNDEHEVISQGYIRKPLVIDDDIKESDLIHASGVTILPNPSFPNSAGKSNIYVTDENEFTYSGFGAIIKITPPQDYTVSELKIYDILGNLVASNNEIQSIDKSDAALYYKWDGLNTNFKEVGSGSYYLIVRYLSKLNTFKYSKSRIYVRQ